MNEKSRGRADEMVQATMPERGSTKRAPSEVKEHPEQVPRRETRGTNPNERKPPMSAQNTATTNWIRVGLLALPVYGILTAWSSLDSQPDQVKDPEAWARYVSTTSYMVSHLIGSTGGTILALFGVFALGAYLATSRAGRLGLAAIVVAAAGHALLLVPSVISTFAAPAIGEAYLAGMEGVIKGVEFHPAMTVTYLLGILLAFVGNVLLGVAVWRSGTLPKWAGALWVVSVLVFYVLGAVLGIFTTGASLPTQPVGAFLMAISGGWMALSAMRPPSTQAVSVQAQPSAH